MILQSIDNAQLFGNAQNPYMPAVMLDNQEAENRELIDGLEQDCSISIAKYRRYYSLVLPHCNVTLTMRVSQWMDQQNLVSFECFFFIETHGN